MNITNKEDKLINIITKYGCIKREQLKILGEIKRELDFNKMLTRILIYAKSHPSIAQDGDVFYSIINPKIDYDMLKCLDILCYFKTKFNDINFIERTDFPYKLMVYRNDKIFDIGTLNPGQEKLIERIIDQDRSEKIILVINKEDCKNIKPLNILNKDKMVIYATTKPVEFIEKI